MAVDEKWEVSHCFTAVIDGKQYIAMFSWETGEQIVELDPCTVVENRSFGQGTLEWKNCPGKGRTDFMEYKRLRCCTV